MDCLIIQIEPDRLRSARFSFSGTGVTCPGVDELSLDGEHDLQKPLFRLLQGGGESVHTVVCLHPSLVAQRVVTLPFTELRKVREVLPGQMQGETALPVEEIVFDALPLEPGEFLALWARRSQVREAIDRCISLGCEPRVVTSGVAAWPFLPGCPDDALVTDGRVVAVVRAGRLRCWQTVPGRDRGEEIRRCLAAWELAGHVLPTRLLVFGRQMADVETLSDQAYSVERLPLPQEWVRLFGNDDVFQNSAELCAVALAYRYKALPDFRRGDLVWTVGDVFLKKRLLITVGLALVAVLLFFVYQGLQYRRAQTDLTSVNSSITTLYREVFPGRRAAVDEIAEIKGELRKLSTRSRGAGVLAQLKGLAEAKGSTIDSLYEVEIEGNALRIKGDARSSQAVTDFKGALGSLAASVTVGELKSKPGGTVGFSLSATLKETGP